MENPKTVKMKYDPKNATTTKPVFFMTFILKGSGSDPAVIEILGQIRFCGSAPHATKS